MFLCSFLKKIQAEYGFTPGPGWGERAMKRTLRLLELLDKVYGAKALIAEIRGQ